MKCIFAYGNNVYQLSIFSHQCKFALHGSLIFVFTTWIIDIIKRIFWSECILTIFYWNTVSRMKIWYHDKLIESKSWYGIMQCIICNVLSYDNSYFQDPNITKALSNNARGKCWKGQYTGMKYVEL